MLVRIGNVRGLRRLQDQPGIGLGLLDHRHCVLDDRHCVADHRHCVPARHSGQHFAHPNRLGLVDAGMRAAGASIEFSQRVEDPLARGPQHFGERMNPQPVGQLLLGGLRLLGGLLGLGGWQFRISHRLLLLTAGLRLPGQEGLGQILGDVIVGHVFSLSPRARQIDAATRGLPLCARTGVRACLWSRSEGLGMRASSAWLNAAVGRSAPHRKPVVAHV